MKEIIYNHFENELSLKNLVQARREMIIENGGQRVIIFPERVLLL